MRDSTRPIEIFKTWQKLHAVLKQDYYLVPGHGEDDAIESSRMDVLIANASRNIRHRRTSHGAGILEVLRFRQRRGRRDRRHVC